MGKRLRARLLFVLEKFAPVFGITLTVDGTLFESALAAWQYVMKNRLLYCLVDRLFRRGHLLSRRYFWVVEWQKETEQAHWHLLVEATRVPFGEIVEIWSRFRPKSAPPLPFKVTSENYKRLERPAFGSVRYSRGMSGEGRRAGLYVSKYFTKWPSSRLSRLGAGLRRASS